MRLFVSFCVLMLLAAGSSANTRIDSTTKQLEDQRTFIVSYSDGSKEQIVVQYVGMLYQKMWQSGRASTLDHPIDNRKCHWRFKSYVERKAHTVHRSGRILPFEGFRQIWNLTHEGDRGADQWYEVFYHRTCGDSRGDYDRALSEHKQGLVRGFDKILSDDRPNIVKHLKAILGSTAVSIRETSEVSGLDNN